MPGLLDAFNSDDGKLGIALLAAAGPSMQPMSFGQRLAGAMQSLDADKKSQLQTSLLQAQADNYKSEIAQRNAALAKQQKLLDMFSGPAPSSAAPAMPGQLGSGSFGIMPTAAGVPSIPQPAPPGQSRIGSMTPDQLVQAKMLGLDLTDVYKLTQPDMQVSNGYAYDKRTVRPGFLPQLNVSQNGQTSMVTIDPRTGLPTVSAPQGAFNTYAGYRNLDEGTKANYDPTTVTPQGENPQMTTRGALVQRLNQIDPKVQAARDVDRKAILQQEVTQAQGRLNVALSAGDQSAAARAQADLAALSRELGGKTPSVGMPLQSDEEKLRSQKGVEADAARNSSLAADAQKSKDTLASIAEARRLLNLNPTHSGVGSLLDSGANLIGQSTKGADVAAKLDTLSGWMVSNVPRMEGPQSNFDVKNYQTMAGLVGDRTKPISQRLEALSTLEKLQQKYAALNGGSNVLNGGGATGSWEQPKPQSAGVLNELPKTAPKGQRVRDTATGKVLQFNGLSWVEVK